MKFRKIIIRNYLATEKRGQISNKTVLEDFLIKLDEEVIELKTSKDITKVYSFNPEEAVDVILVMCSLLRHYGFDVKILLKDKMKKNEERANSKLYFNFENLKK